MSLEPFFKDRCGAGEWGRGGDEGGETREDILPVGLIPAWGRIPGRNFGEQKEITTGTWSVPVDGRGVSHLLKAGDNRELAKARSRTEGLEECVKGK